MYIDLLKLFHAAKLGNIGVGCLFICIRCISICIITLFSSL